MAVVAMERVQWESFDDFVRATTHALWRQAWLLTHDAGRAEDLVQAALAKSYPRFERLNRDGHSFEAYLRRVMYTTWLSWWRRRWRDEVPTDLVDDLPPAGGSGGVSPRLSVDLARALQELPRAQRAVVVLRYVEDLSEAETAATLGISAGTVKSHASRGLAALRRSAHLSQEES